MKGRTKHAGIAVMDDTGTDAEYALDNFTEQDCDFDMAWATPVYSKQDL